MRLNLAGASHKKKYSISNKIFQILHVKFFILQSQFLNVILICKIQTLKQLFSSLHWCGAINGIAYVINIPGNEANPGVIPLAMRLFFASIKHNLIDGISVKPDKFADIRELTDKEVDKEVQLKEQLIQQSEQEVIYVLLNYWSFKPYTYQWS